MRNNPADAKVSEEGEEVLQVLVQAVPEQRVEEHSASDNHAAVCGGPHVGAGASGLWRAHTGAGFWQKL